MTNKNLSEGSTMCRTGPTVQTSTTLLHRLSNGSPAPGSKMKRMRMGGASLAAAGFCLLLAVSALAQDGQKAQQEKLDHDRALAIAGKAMDAGEYDKAIELATLVLQGWPGDRGATDILTRSNLRKAMQAVGSDGATVAPKGQPIVQPVPPAQPPQTAPPTVSETQPTQPATEMLSIAPPALKAPKATKHEISVAGDFMLGQGTVTIPTGFALSQVGLLTPNVNKADRDSQYFGGTLSYSYGQAWYLDLGYIRGESSGTIDYDFVNGAGGKLTFPAGFTINDEWYQAYLRYTFPRLRGKKLSAYLRLGFSYVQADLTVNSPFPGGGLYDQSDTTEDLLGNLGFGVGYSLYSGRRFRVGLQVEGEGFYGNRSQESLERVNADLNPNVSFPTASIDNTLYGGIGRGTVRFEYRLGQSGLFKVFAEGGMQMKYTMLDYPDAGNFTELLWGPYIKAGMRYAF